MTVNTTTINGFIVLPDDTVREKSSVIFAMTGFDTDADDNATVVPIPIEAPIAADGSINVDLWPNPEGVRTTFYRVKFSIYNGNRPILVDGGLIEVPATGGPYDLNDLLPIAPPSGATVDEYIAQLAAAVASAEDAADTAVAAATPAAELIANVRLTRDDFSDLASVTSSQIAVGEYARVISLGFTFQRVSDAATDYDFETSSGVRMSSAYLPRWRAPQHSVSGLSRLVLSLALSPDDAGGSVGFSDVKILGMGSSVGVGANTEQSMGGAKTPPVKKFAELFSQYFDRLSFGNVTYDNQSVSGDAVIQGNDDWKNGTITSGGASLCLHIWGMNDAGSAIFNAGQTYPGFIKFLTELCMRQVKSGITPVLVTSPHAHTQRRDYSMPSSVTMSWPRSVSPPVPDADVWPPVSESVVSITRNGLSCNASARMLMVNDAMRAVAGIVPGCVLIDVEPYWFEAVSIFGEDALYETYSGGTGESVHPNLRGHELSYHRAFEDAIRAAAEGMGSEVFQGPQHTQVIAGIDPQRSGQLLRTELQPDAPLGVVSNDVFSNAIEIYGKDRALDRWIVVDDGASSGNPTDNANPREFSVSRTRDRTSGWDAVKTAQLAVAQGAGSTETFTIDLTRAAGTVRVMGWSSANGGVTMRTYQFVKNGTSWAIEELGSGATLGAGATYQFQVTGSGDDLVFTNELSGSSYQMWIEYGKAGP